MSLSSKSIYLGFSVGFVLYNPVESVEASWSSCNGNQGFFWNPDFLSMSSIKTVIVASII